MFSSLSPTTSSSPKTNPQNQLPQSLKKNSLFFRLSPSQQRSNNVFWISTGPSEKSRRAMGLLIRTRNSRVWSWTEAVEMIPRAEEERFVASSVFDRVVDEPHQSTRRLWAKSPLDRVACCLAWKISTRFLVELGLFYPSINIKISFIWRIKAGNIFSLD